MGIFTPATVSDPVAREALVLLVGGVAPLVLANCSFLEGHSHPHSGPGAEGATVIP